MSYSASGIRIPGQRFRFTSGSPLTDQVITDPWYAKQQEVVQVFEHAFDELAARGLFGDQQVAISVSGHAATSPGDYASVSVSVSNIPASQVVDSGASTT